MTVPFSVPAIVYGRKGNKYGDKRKRTLSKVFMVLACASFLPLTAVAVSIIYSVNFTKISLPDGKRKLWVCFLTITPIPM